ncbi:MAG: sugar transferase [Anaerolineaceae bacterium]|nr:sugar transferase [Anaerolineaceae bacterium]
MRSRAVQSSLALRDPITLQRMLKRGVDVTGAVVLLALLSPIFLAIAVMLRCAPPGKVFYRQARIGKGGKSFELLKFCSMRSGAGEGFQEFLNLNPAQRLEYDQYQKLKDDPRLTRLGKVLRRYSLDELPQLWNVLRGEMSLVGPRPFLDEQAALYGPGLWFYTQVRPGLTGLWQISGRNQLSFRERVQCDLDYLANWSIWIDLVILWQTPGVVMRGKGAY